MADLVVVGGGPAGVSAALAAAERGVEAMLVDSSPLLGGQIWRGTTPPPVQAAHAHPRVRVAASTTVVHAAARVGGGARLTVRDANGLQTLDARTVVLATGASELSLPFPGWDLPGVVTPGAAQALLKAHGVNIGTRVVVAGTGPFLWPVAAGLARAGVRVAALVEAARLRGPAAGQARTPRLGGLMGLAGLVGHPNLGWQAARYAATIGRARTPILTGHVVVAARGTDRVESVVLARADGSAPREIEVDAACVSWGFVPAVELARSIGCRELPHPTRPITTVAVDAKQHTSVSGVFAAGEITGIAGAIMAAAEGAIAGAAAAAQLGVPGRQPRRALAARRRAARAADAFERAFPLPLGWLDRLEADTVVCRCEDVTWRQVADVIADGVTDVRAIKGQVRCGMGWCQGRICGPALQLATAVRGGRPVDVVGDLANRRFATAPTIGELADSGQ